MDKDIKISAKAVIRRNGKILLLKDDGTKFWDLPGGHLKEGETLEDGLIREVYEETTLKLKNLKQFTTEQLTLGKENKPVCFFICEADGEPKLSEEHLDFKWVSIDNINDFNTGVFEDIIEDTKGLHMKKSDDAQKIKNAYALSTWKLQQQGINNFKSGSKGRELRNKEVNRMTGTINPKADEQKQLKMDFKSRVEDILKEYEWPLEKKRTDDALYRSGLRQLPVMNNPVSQAPHEIREADVVNLDAYEHKVVPEDNVQNSMDVEPLEDLKEEVQDRKPHVKTELQQKILGRMKTLAEEMKKAYGEELVAKFINEYKSQLLLKSEYQNTQLLSELANLVNNFYGFGIEKHPTFVEEMIPLTFVAKGQYGIATDFLDENGEQLISVDVLKSEISPNMVAQKLYEYKLASCQCTGCGKSSCIKALNKELLSTNIMKSLPLETGKRFWDLFEMALKNGINSLKDNDLLILREFLYARV